MAQVVAGNSTTIYMHDVVKRFNTDLAIQWHDRYLDCDFMKSRPDERFHIGYINIILNMRLKLIFRQWRRYSLLLLLWWILYRVAGLPPLKEALSSSNNYPDRKDTK